VIWSKLCPGLGGEDGTGFLPFPLSWVRPKSNGGRLGHVSHPVKTLGATRSGVTRMVLKDVPGMVCGGMVIGALLAFRCKSFAASLIGDMPVESVIPILFGAICRFRCRLYMTSGWQTIRPLWADRRSKSTLKLKGRLPWTSLAIPR
jgi:hypothetical protein